MKKGIMPFPSDSLMPICEKAYFKKYQKLATLIDASVETNIHIDSTPLLPHLLRMASILWKSKSQISTL